MSPRFKFESKHHGFIGMVFVIILLITAVVAAIASMSRGSATGAAGQSTAASVSVALKQTADFKVGFDQMVAGNIDPSLVTFDQATGTGLFDPAARYAILNRPPGALVASGAPIFTYNNQVFLPGIGLASKADYVVSLGNVLFSGCVQINHLLYGDAVSAVLAVSTGSMADWTSAPAVILDSGTPQTGAPNYNGRAEGCVATTDGKYIYYKALAEN